MVEEHADEIHRLMVLLKKRGAPSEHIHKIAKGHLMQACQEMMDEIESEIMPRLAVFSPLFGKGEEAYNTQASQLAEVPAIIEELKGKYGRTFIADLLPNLSRLCEQHRAEIFRL